MTSFCNCLLILTYIQSKSTIICVRVAKTIWNLFDNLTHLLESQIQYKRLFTFNFELFKKTRLNYVVLQNEISSYEENNLIVFYFFNRSPWTLKTTGLEGLTIRVRRASYKSIEPLYLFYIV